MKVETKHFGTIDVPEDKIITFRDGLLGLPGGQKFTLMEDEIGHPFQWLQCLDKPEIAVVVVDPLIVDQQYLFTVPSSAKKDLQGSNVDDLEVYVVVTMAPNILDVTANLMGPLVIDKKSRLGIQHVLVDGRWSAETPIFDDRPQTEIEAVARVGRQNELALKRGSTNVEGV